MPAQGAEQDGPGPHPREQEDDMDSTAMTPTAYRKTLHGACPDGLAWAGAEGVTSNQEAWDRLGRPDWMIWLLEHRGVQSDEGKLRHFACDCAERALSLAPQPDPRSIAAVAAARRYADGKASRAELAAARAAAGDADWDAAEAACDAAWDARAAA
jgi:hypothetical protein